MIDLRASPRGRRTRSNESGVRLRSRLSTSGRGFRTQLQQLLRCAGGVQAHAWDMKWAVWDDSLNIQVPRLDRPVNGCMQPYGCHWARAHPWQPPDNASAKMPWFRSLVVLRDRPPIPGLWCPCKPKCPCTSCSDARAKSLGLEIVVESEGAHGVARLL